MQYPPTPKEQEVLDLIKKHEIGVSVLTEPGFWERTPAKRRADFKEIRRLVEEMIAEFDRPELPLHPDLITKP